MKISINVNQFQEVIKKGQKLIPNSRKTKLPAIQTMYLAGEENKITAIITDLETSLIFDIPGTVLEEGKTLLNVDTLKLISKLKNVFELEITDNTITAGNKTLKYNSVDADIFPANYPSCELEGFKTTEKEMINLLSIQYAAGNDENRPIFTGIFIDKESFVCTDTHRLARKEIKFENNLPEKGIIISNSAIKFLNSLLDKKSNNEIVCNISENNNYLQFKFDNITIVTRLIEGTYPNYKAVFPQNFNTTITANVKNLLEELAFIEQITKDDHILTFCTENNTWFIDAANINNAVTLNIPVTLTGENIELMGINYNYLVDVLKQHTGNEIEFKISGMLSPIVIDNNHLILPIKTAGRRKNVA